MEITYSISQEWSQPEVLNPVEFVSVLAIWGRQSLLPLHLSIPGKKHTQLQSKCLKGIVFLALIVNCQHNQHNLTSASSRACLGSVIAALSFHQDNLPNVGFPFTCLRLIRSRGFSRKSLLKGWTGDQCYDNPETQCSLGYEPVTPHLTPNNSYARAFGDENFWFYRNWGL